MSTDLSSWPQSPPPVSVPPVSPGGEGPRPIPAPVPRVAHTVLVHLTNDDRIEVAVHDDEASARAEAMALMRYLRDGRGDWPYLAGRFVRPDAIVSIDIDETSR